MTATPDSPASAQSPRPPRALVAMLLFPVIVCWILYFYYLFAQSVEHPAPVTGTLKSAACTGGSISQQGAKTSIVEMRAVYAFPSRSRDYAGRTAKAPALDEIAEYVEYDRASDCEAAVLALPKGTTKTVWAGENSMNDRFRARLTAERQYPPLALLWGPILFAAAVFWGWRRFAARGA